jgi:uncharacterized Zn-binding protein involved in type VI secretion
MAAIALENCLSQGHDEQHTWPQTLPLSGLSTKTKVHGKYVVLKDSTKYEAHSKGNTIHTADSRIVTGGSTKAKIEGKSIARLGDSIGDGDTIDQGYSKVNVG